MKTLSIAEPQAPISIRFKTDGYRYTNFQALFAKTPSLFDLTQAQIKAGYHPCGYGGPYRPMMFQTIVGVEVTWNCSGSCD